MSDHFADECGWAGPVSGERVAFLCRKRKMTFGEADRDIGICPCSFWVKRFEKKPKKEAYKGAKLL